LLFSLFLDDPAHASPHEVEALAKALASDDAAVRERARAAVDRVTARRRQRYGFVDEIPERPLSVARYEKEYALELVDGTGWEVVALHPPDRFIQHYMVCRPI
jgi:hypothetical protein